MGHGTNAFNRNQIETEALNLEALNRQGDEQALNERLLKDFQVMGPSTYREVMKCFQEVNQADKQAGIKRKDGSELPDITWTDSRDPISGPDVGAVTKWTHFGPIGLPTDLFKNPGADKRFETQEAAQWATRSAYPELRDFHYQDGAYTQNAQDVQNYFQQQRQGAPQYYQGRVDQTIGQKSQKYYVDGRVIYGLPSENSTMTQDEANEILRQANQRRGWLK